MRIWIFLVGATGLAVAGLAAQIPSPASIRQAILAIEDARAPELDDVDTLLEAARQRDESLSVAAVRALGRLERPSLVDDLIDFLAVDSPGVRAQAAHAIGQSVSAASGEPVGRARLVLQKRLAAEQDASVRAVIAETLGRLPYGAPESVRAVESVLLELSLRPSRAVNTRPSTSALGTPVMGVTIGFDTTRQDAPLPVLLGAVKGLEALIRQNIKIAEPALTTTARLQRLLVTARASVPAGMDQSTSDLARVRRLALQAAVNYGVVPIPRDEAGARKVFEFAKKMGMPAVTTESAEAIDTIEKLVKGYNIAVGFHNHPGGFSNPDYKVWNPYYIAGLVTGRDQRIGAAAGQLTLDILRGPVTQNFRRDAGCSPCAHVQLAATQAAGTCPRTPCRRGAGSSTGSTRPGNGTARR